MTPEAEAPDATAAAYRRVWYLLVLVGALHLLLYLLLVPPFNAPDEPSHFQYAEQIARAGGAVDQPREDEALKRAVAEQRIRFKSGPWDWSERRVDVALFTPVPHDRPWYYALAAIPARLAGTPDLLIDLRLMRLISVLLGLLTAGLSARAAWELTGGNRAASLAVGAFVLLLPGHAFVAGTMNSDNLANAGAALAFLGAARLIRSRAPATGALLLLCGAVISLRADRSGVVVAVLALGVLGWWVLRAVHRRWRRVALASTGAAVGLVVALAVAGAPRLLEADPFPSHWEGCAIGPATGGPGLHGASAFRVGAEQDETCGLRQYFLPPADGEHRLTLSAYARAEGDLPLQLLVQVYDGLQWRLTGTFEVGRDWAPLLVPIELPDNDGPRGIMLEVRPSDPGGTGQVFVDEVFLASGSHATAPAVARPGCEAGTWEGREIPNLLRNGCAAWTFQRPRPEVLARVFAVAQFPPETLTNLTDLGGALEPGRWATQVVVPAWESFWGVFGWFHVRLPGWWYSLLLVPAALAVAVAAGRAFGAVRGRRPAFGLLAFPGAWVGVVLLAVSAPYVLQVVEVSGQAQGRFLYPALGAVAVLLAGGAVAWPSAVVRRRALLLWLLWLGGGSLLALAAQVGGYYLP